MYNNAGIATTVLSVLSSVYYQRMFESSVLIVECFEHYVISTISVSISALGIFLLIVAAEEKNTDMYISHDQNRDQLINI